MYLINENLAMTGWLDAGDNLKASIIDGRFAEFW